MLSTISLRSRSTMFLQRQVFQKTSVVCRLSLFDLAAIRTHTYTQAKHFQPLSLPSPHVQGILPFIRLLLQSNETVFGHVPELRMPALSHFIHTITLRMQAAALQLTIHPSRNILFYGLSILELLSPLSKLLHQLGSSASSCLGAAEHTSERHLCGY